MGTHKRLIVSATGFPGTTETLRFIHEGYAEPLKALAQLAGNFVILSGCEVVGTSLTRGVTSGFVVISGEILPFVGQNFPITTTYDQIMSMSITVVEDVQEAIYDVDNNGDGQLDSLPAYATKHVAFGSNGLMNLTLDSFTRLKTIEQLSSFELPNGVVVDPNYLAFTHQMLEKLNGIEFGAEVNVQADWANASPGSDAYIQNKPFNDIVCDFGIRQMLNPHPFNQDPPAHVWNNENQNYANIIPPVGYSTTHLIGFMASLAVVSFAGIVDNNDVLFCRYRVDHTNNRVRVWGSNSEHRHPAFVHYFALYKK